MCVLIDPKKEKTPKICFVCYVGIQEGQELGRQHTTNLYIDLEIHGKPTESTG